MQSSFNIGADMSFATDATWLDGNKITCGASDVSRNALKWINILADM